MYPTTPFGGERDIVRRIIPLALHSWTGFESLRGQFQRMWPEPTQPLPHDRVVTLETPPAQLLMQMDRRDIRIALQQLCKVIGEWVQHARPSRMFHFHRFCSVLFVTH